MWWLAQLQLSVRNWNVCQLSFSQGVVFFFFPSNMNPLGSARCVTSCFSFSSPSVRGVCSATPSSTSSGERFVSVSATRPWRQIPASPHTDRNTERWGTNMQKEEFLWGVSKSWREVFFSPLGFCSFILARTRSELCADVSFPMT